MKRKQFDHHLSGLNQSRLRWSHPLGGWMVTYTLLVKTSMRMTITPNEVRYEYLSPDGIKTRLILTNLHIYNEEQLVDIFVSFIEPVELQITESLKPKNK